ncbi:phosphatidylinositol-glycan biosynthesis class X protein-like [Gigantopelta aegis]|uniref:phosphatidylinositol-glycan biosynthesis class X protein-like n=1 Tax=Gigantopelta aegis TaxID=1735272 RepID=UPI001B889E32|nr:phosphatidylinositol-glycan biosynthesis class X protein-like [Gigantopelta aegis]XP_041362715.1 phosphatidylinositol-glycan biosynthesis class X protein-like [Gigantopelta aegis]XP_041362716.1 phosphatidylinositol-glycan biosynthesis class X protein-like [Gigantopelta aegis]XP_041362717.1 phosphatidylinositol-glycan biosynthesis class X protein-like [Gigantopelta aegis]XP_041362718.1 phosphatidylinositol-glycan biosynthesis class X protein-like [Gigantopelta aegis]
MRAMRNLTICAVFLVSLARSDKPQIKRHLTKNGFHRDLVTHIEWNMKPFHGSRLDNCHLLMQETLPAGLYVDPYQLNSLLPFGGPQVLIDQPVDIEAPEYKSSPLNIYVFARLYPVKQSKGQHTADVTLPLHLRYHRPSSRPGQKYHRLTINNPVIFTNCSVHDSEGLSVSACDYLNSSVCWWHQHPVELVSGAIKLSIPIGHQSHLTLVVIGTLSVTAAGCLFIMYTVITKDLSTNKKTI